MKVDTGAIWSFTNKITTANIVLVMKKCSNKHCEVENPKFHKNKSMKDGLSNTCKVCKLKAVKNYRQTETGKRNHAKASSKARNSEKGKVYKLQYRLNKDFGLSIEEYEKILEDQNGCCAICKVNQSFLTLRLAVDHNHQTGKIRGLLCGKCNTAIGLLRDSKEIILEAYSYLNQYE